MCLNTPFITSWLFLKISPEIIYNVTIIPVYTIQPVVKPV